MDSEHSYRALRYIAGNETAIKDIAQTINTLNADATTVKLHPFPDQQSSGAKDIVATLKTAIATIRLKAGNEPAVLIILPATPDETLISGLNGKAAAFVANDFTDADLPSTIAHVVQEWSENTPCSQTGQMKCSGATMFHCVSSLTASLPKLSATYTFGTSGYRYNPFFEHSNTSSEIYIDKIIAAVKTTIKHPIIKRAFVTAAIQTYIHNEPCKPSFATGLAAFSQRVGKVTVCSIDAGSLATAMEQNTWLTASSITMKKK